MSTGTLCQPVFPPRAVLICSPAPRSCSSAQLTVQAPAGACPALGVCARVHWEKLSTVSDVWQPLVWCLCLRTARQGRDGLSVPCPEVVSRQHRLLSARQLHPPLSGSRAVDCGHQRFGAARGGDVLGTEPAWQVNRWVFAEASSEQSE